MGKKSDDGKIGAIKGTGSTSNVQGADSVGVVGGVKATSSVGAVKGPGAIGKRRATRIMSTAERENLMRLINEEAEKLFEDSAMSPERKEVLKSAVKMAVDAGIVTEDDAKESDSTKKK
ncbi:MAG: hypothetical protein J0M12_03085 [Deltaproteobacteria bacterium]|nr:hypothetical protein [Deltaproteobacteria bacterium]